MENENTVTKTPADAESFAEYKALRAPAPPPEPAAEPAPKAEEPKPEPDKPSEPAEETPASQSADAPEPSEQPTQEQQERKRRDRTAEGRIAELTAARRKAEEEAAELRRKLDQMQVPKPASEIASEPPAPKPAAENDPDPKPKLKTFLDREDISYEDATDLWEEAVADWRERKRQRTARESQVRETVTSRLAAARAEYPDFDEVTYGNPQTGQGLVLTQPMQQYAQESEGAMRVFYHLGKNPELYRGIAALSPIRQISELGKLEASLQPNAQANAPKPEPPKPPVSRAPAPPRIVGGVDTSVRRDTSEASSMDEYRRIRRAQMQRG